MKKALALILTLVTLATVCAACGQENVEQQPTEPPLVSFDATDGPTATASPTPSPTPEPTPTPVPVQTKSICPAALLKVGYKTPIEDAPMGYNKNYMIEVDLTNQVINIFIKGETGKYNVLLNRFICSSGTASQPSKEGRFYIKSDKEQQQSYGGTVHAYRFWFPKYSSYAYYVTRYYNEYMFHSFTFGIGEDGYIKPKGGAYNSMGKPGSAGCLRMLMNHAKWIYENIEAGTYLIVTSDRKKDADLCSVMKKFVPPLGYDMDASWDGNRNNYNGLTPIMQVAEPEKSPNKLPTAEPTTPPEETPEVPVTEAPLPVTPEPTQEPTPVAEETPEPQEENE